MKRNATSVKGPGWSKAFERAATATPDERRAFERVVVTRSNTCDRSADAGSVHVFPEGSQNGDLCICGKRTKVVLPPDWPRI